MLELLFDAEWLAGGSSAEAAAAVPAEEYAAGERWIYLNSAAPLCGWLFTTGLACPLAICSCTGVLHLRLLPPLPPLPCRLPHPFLSCTTAHQCLPCRRRDSARRLCSARTALAAARRKHCGRLLRRGASPHPAAAIDIGSGPRRGSGGGRAAGQRQAAGVSRGTDAAVHSLEQLVYIGSAHCCRMNTCISCRICGMPCMLGAADADTSTAHVAGCCTLP